MESIPDSGVEIRKAEVAPLFTPAFLRVIAVGITEQEQRGKGTPTSDALTIEAKFYFPSHFRTNDIGTSNLIIPANKNPPNKKGAEITINFHRAIKNSINNPHAIDNT